MDGFLNIKGTFKNIFSLGKQLNQVFIRTNNGILEGKNNSGSYLPILNIDDSASTAVDKTWSANKISGILPPQSGHANNVLSTDGTSLSWTDIGSLPSSNILAENTATQSVQGGVHARVLFPMEVTDEKSEFDYTTSIFTSDTSQTVLVSSSVVMTGLGNDRLLYLYIYKNGTSFIYTTNTSGGAGTSGIVGVNLSFILNLDANDTIEIYTYHTDGSHTRDLIGTQMLSIVQLK